MCKGPEVEKEVGPEIQEIAQSRLKCLPGLNKSLGFTLIKIKNQQRDLNRRVKTTTYNVAGVKCTTCLRQHYS